MGTLGFHKKIRDPVNERGHYTKIQFAHSNEMKRSLALHKTVLPVSKATLL